MKRFIACVSAIIILITAVVMTIPASAIGQEMVIRYGTPVIDGYIERAWYTADRLRLMNITAGKDDNGRLPAFSGAYVSVMWDYEAIYFLFEIIDDDPTFDSKGEYKNDCINIYIDEADVYGETWQEGQSQIRLVPAGDEPIRVVHGKEPLYSQIGYRYENNSYIIEYKYIPAEFKIEDGAQLLVDFSFDDINEEGELTYRFTWSDEIGEGETDSSNWSYLCFGSKSSSKYGAAADAANALGITPIKGYEFYSGTNGNPNESADKLWDGDVLTKFCTGEFPLNSAIKCTQKYYVTGVLMATANDTKEYVGRNPKKWRIEGSNDGKNWTEIISGDDSFFENVNYTYFSTTVDCDEAYSYFRFVCDKAESGCFQLSEVTICGTTVKNGVNANANKEEIVQTIVPGGTIVEQISYAYKNLNAGDSAEEIVANNGVAAENSVSDNIIIAGIIIVLSAAIVVILYIQHDPVKKKHNN